MGNALGGKRSVKVMKIDGEELNLKAPIKAGEVTKEYPGHVILDSEAVKHYGTRAKPLSSAHDLKPRRLYFLVHLPATSSSSASMKTTRRVRSGIHVSAKDRLDGLVLARRSASDLSILNNNNKSAAGDSPEMGGAGVRVKMRLPKSEVERVMRESKDKDEAAHKILQLCRNLNNNNNDDDEAVMQSITEDGNEQHRTRPKKRVSFGAVNNGGEIQIAVA